MDAAATTDLLMGMLRGVPSMPDAACAGMAPLFDPIDVHADREMEEYRINAALAICRDCSCLSACQAVYGDSGPVYGVTAGRYVPAPQQFPTYRAPGRQRAPREPRAAS